MILKLRPLLFCLILSACNGVATSALAASITPVELSHRKFTLTFSATENIVIRESAIWQRLWRERIATIGIATIESIDQGSSVPAVNFDQQMVIGIFLGGYPNSCYSIAIVSVEQEGERTRVAYQVNSSETTDICAQAFSYPMKLIAVPKKSGEVLFVDVSKK